jgi:hypothetical protein
VVPRPGGGAGLGPGGLDDDEARAREVSGDGLDRAVQPFDRRRDLATDPRAKLHPEHDQRLAGPDVDRAQGDDPLDGGILGHAPAVSAWTCNGAASPMSSE